MPHGKSRKNKPNKQPKGEPKRRELVRALSLEILGFFATLWFVWPVSHAWALALGCLLIAIHFATSSWSKKKRVVSCVMLLALTALAVWRSPPVETKTHGFLVPASGNMPFYDCNGVRVTSGQVYGVAFGGNLATITRGQTVVALSVSGKPLLSFRVTEQGLMVSGDIFGESGENALLVNNQFWLNPNSTWHSEHPNKSTLIIRDNSGQETAFISFTHRNFVVFKGTLYVPNIGTIKITDRAVTGPKGSVHDSCFEGAQSLINVFANGTFVLG